MLALDHRLTDRKEFLASIYSDKTGILFASHTPQGNGLTELISKSSNTCIKYGKCIVSHRKQMSRRHTERFLTIRKDEEKKQKKNKKKLVF